MQGERERERLGELRDDWRHKDLPSGGWFGGSGCVGWVLRDTARPRLYHQLSQRRSTLLRPGQGHLPPRKHRAVAPWHQLSQRRSTLLRPGQGHLPPRKHRAVAPWHQLSQRRSTLLRPGQGHLPPHKHRAVAPWHQLSQRRSTLLRPGQGHLPPRKHRAVAPWRGRTCGGSGRCQFSRYRFKFRSNLVWDSMKPISNFCFQF
jgi:hypothetical protein